MGSALKKVSSSSSKQDEARILMCTLGVADKTTILYVTKLGKVVTRIPTIGFNVETLKHGDLTLTVWDVCDRNKSRPLWRHYYQNTSALVFVIDSNDRETLSGACEQLHKMANEDELRNRPILIFANKQDLPSAQSLDELKEGLKLSKLDEMKTKWHLQPTVTIKNEGFNEGFEWLANALQTKDNPTQPIIETINDSKIVKNDLLYFLILRVMNL